MVFVTRYLGKPIYNRIKQELTSGTRSVLDVHRLAIQYNVQDPIYWLIRIYSLPDAQRL